MITPMRVTVFAAAIAAAAPLVAQPVKAVTAVVQPQSTVSDLGSEKPVVEVGWRGRGGYGGVYRRGVMGIGAGVTGIDAVTLIAGATGIDGHFMGAGIIDHTAGFTAAGSPVMAMVMGMATATAMATVTPMSTMAMVTGTAMVTVMAMVTGMAMVMGIPVATAMAVPVTVTGSVYQS